MLTDQLAYVATMNLADAAHALGVAARTWPVLLARNGISIVVLSPRRKRVKVADIPASGGYPTSIRLSIKRTAARLISPPAGDSSRCSTIFIIRT